MSARDMDAAQCDMRAHKCDMIREFTRDIVHSVRDMHHSCARHGRDIDECKTWNGVVVCAHP